ncbi:MAG: radical SAM protein [Candidatus Eremiobacteraeota bacterium]|nr:radical SAM protein [Candidatus Eremiobacteraeota bacterium]
MKRFLLIEAQKLWELDLPVHKTIIPLDLVQPLGLAQIASIIRQRYADARIRILDLRLLKNDFSTLPGLIRDFEPEFIGFRTVSRDSIFMNDMVRMVRALMPSALLVGGGPHVTAMRGRVMEEAPFDFAVFGEGEITLLDLLYHLDEGGDMGEVKGLIYRDSEGRIRENAPQDTIDDLDSLPMPAWDLVDHEQYFKAMYYPLIPAYLNARREVVSIFTSRGCPYKCTFCHNIFGKRFRARSPEKVVEEIEYLYTAFGCRQFDFRDDIFNLDKKRVHRICDLIIKRGLDIRMAFPNGIRGDIMDEELILKLKAAGMFRCTYALETASPRLQKMTRKNIDLDKLRHIIRFTSAQGIIIRIFVMLGFPTETREEMRETLEYAFDPAIDFLILNTVNPFEGTEMAESLRASGVNLDEFRDKYDYLEARMSVSEVSAQELQAIKDDAVNRFFSEERFAMMAEKLTRHIPARKVMAPSAQK